MLAVSHCFVMVANSDVSVVENENPSSSWNGLRMINKMPLGHAELFLIMT